ncbi:hypothetical protein [Azospirillum himalayense]|uniref:Uncharacterized protein n=1 Tax=Azospirillum himalayense TaxID=654847 RepID=A0ABW0G389_9PROT
MDTRFVAFAGSAPEGADALRERLRWAAAERRWHGLAPVTPRRPPTLSPSGLEALRHGAQLTRFTETGRARAS